MEKIKFTQFGTLSVAVMLPIFVFVLVLMFTVGLNDQMVAARSTNK